MTTSEERIKNIAKKAEGFIYTVTMNATTGENGQFHPELKRKIELIKGVTPVVAGFGIRNQEHVKDIGRIADGVVIGSEIVKDSLRVILVRCFNFKKHKKDTRSNLKWQLIGWDKWVFQPFLILRDSYIKFIFEYFIANQGKLIL